VREEGKGGRLGRARCRVSGEGRWGGGGVKVRVGGRGELGGGGGLKGGKAK